MCCKAKEITMLKKKLCNTGPTARRRRRILAVAPSALFPGEVVPVENIRKRFDRVIGALYGTFTSRDTKATSIAYVLDTRTPNRYIELLMFGTIFTLRYVDIPTSELYEMSIDTRETSQLSTLGRTALDDFKAEWTHMCIFAIVFHPFICIQMVVYSLNTP